MALKDKWSKAKPGQDSTSYIDAGCEFSGSLHFRESVCIDGTVEGEIRGDKTVTIGPSASVHANIVCESVVIHGHVEGDIEARRQIAFHKGARVNGKMRASGIVVEEGSKFKGNIEIGDDEPPVPVLAQAAKRSAAAEDSD